MHLGLFLINCVFFLVMIGLCVSDLTRYANQGSQVRPLDALVIGGFTSLALFSTFGLVIQIMGFMLL